MVLWRNNQVSFYNNVKDVFKNILLVSENRRLKVLLRLKISWVESTFGFKSVFGIKSTFGFNSPFGFNNTFGFTNPFGFKSTFVLKYFFGFIKEFFEIILTQHSLIVRLLSIEMRSRIHQPCAVQTQRIPEQINIPRIVPRFAPKVHRHNSGEQETHERHQNHVVLLLKSENGIVVQIGKVKQLPLLSHLRMMATQKPSDVREKESSFCAVWISVSFAVFVVDSVVACPIYYRILKKII